MPKKPEQQGDKKSYEPDWKTPPAPKKPKKGKGK